jgi:hypothetical protein
MISKLPFILTLAFLILLCVAPDSADASKRRIARKPGEPRELTRVEQVRIEGYMNYFSHALFRYCCIYGEYPVSARTLVKSGLIVVWPINPLTGRPVRFIRNIREGEYKYAGEMCYVYNSPKAGFFKGIFETTRSMGWEYYEFPDVVDQSKLEQLKKSNPESYSEKEPYRFAKSMASLFGTLKNIHLDEKTGKLPKSTEELLGNNFRILREYYRPKYSGDDDQHGGFFELGVDLKAGFWYSIYKTRPDYTYHFAHRFPYQGLSLVEREFVDEDFPELETPIPLLGSSVYPDVLTLPGKVLMSVDDIKYVRD